MTKLQEEVLVSLLRGYKFVSNKTRSKQVHWRVVDNLIAMGLVCTWFRTLTPQQQQLGFSYRYEPKYVSLTEKGTAVARALQPEKEVNNDREPT